jgi:hypothetical protein
MKKKRMLLISLMLILVLALGSCDFFAGLFDPLIGTWEYLFAIPPMSYTLTMKIHAGDKLDLTEVIAVARTVRTRPP